MAEPEPTQLTPLQIDLMRVLWGRGEATAAEVQAALAPERPLAPTTVATLLRRLEKRGLVAHRSAGRQFVYRPTVAEEQACDAMVEELAERLFDGDAARLVHHLIARHELAPGDLARVRALIDARERERRPDREAR
jgi:BlaI family penicillinase repressor